ncbi:MAG: hypothetical protein ACJ79H_14430 [Myxococcales bacterium]
MLRANQAVRLGLRAASRNPELSFGKALLDAVGSVLSLLPWLSAAILVAAAVGRLEPLLGVVAAAVALGKMRWALAGGALAAAGISWTIGSAFWAGALPVLAADAELQRRPPAGHFWPLAVRGFARVVAAGALGAALLLAFELSLLAGVLWGAVAMLGRPTAAAFALLALAACVGIAGAVLLDALARLMLVRAAAFGEGALAAFARASDVLGRRLGACVAIQLAFLLLEAVVATVAGLFTGILWTGFDPAFLLVALPPRLAAGLAFGAVFAWLEVARQGALAALAADAEGLIDLPPEPQPVPPAPAVLQRPEPIEALPVIDALPAPPPDDEKS